MKLTSRKIKHADKCGDVTGDRSICGCNHLGLDCKYDECERKSLKSLRNQVSSETPSVFRLIPMAVLIAIYIVFLIAMVLFVAAIERPNSFIMYLLFGR